MVTIPASTEDIINRSTFRRAGTFRYASVRGAGDVSKHLMITRDEKELTVVTAEENLRELDVIEVNKDRWLLLTIDCANPFYCVGFLAKISTALSGAGIDILVVSTFSRDWVMVKEEDGDRAAELLREAGFTEA